MNCILGITTIFDSRKISKIQEALNKANGNFIQNLLVRDEDKVKKLPILLCDCGHTLWPVGIHVSGRFYSYICSCGKTHFNPINNNHS